FMSPTLFGNAGLLVPPTVNAHTSASPMFTLRSPLRSPCSMSHNWTIFENRPLGFVTFTPWFPIVARAAPVTCAVNWVPLTRVVVRSAAPSDTTAPTSKFVPLTVRINRPPYHGATAWLKPGSVASSALIVGAGDVTVNELNGSEFPCGAMTLTLRAVRGALDAILIVTGRLISVRPVPMVAVTPDPLKTTAVAPVNPVPLTVAPSVLFTTPEFGLIPVITGRACVTVKLLNGADVPLGVVTVNVRVSVAAPAAIVTVMGRPLAVPPVPIVAVTPLPLKLTAVAPLRFDPLMVAATLVPGAPEDGVIPVIIGPDVTVNPLNAGDVPAGVVTVKVRVSAAAPVPI